MPNFSLRLRVCALKMVQNVFAFLQGCKPVNFPDLWSKHFQIGYKGFILYLFFVPFVIFVVIAGSLLTGVANDQDIPIHSFR
jgi:hypothetical protein